MSANEQDGDLQERLARLEHILVYVLSGLDPPSSDAGRARISDWLAAYEQDRNFGTEGEFQGSRTSWTAGRAETEALAQAVGQLGARLDHSASVLKTVDDSLFSLEARANAFSRWQTEVESDLLPWLGMMSLGVDISQVPLKRFVPVRLYVDGGPFQDLQDAKYRLETFLAVFGFEVTDDVSVEYGSIFRKFWARTADTLTQPEVLDRLEKLERAAVVRGLEKPQAEVDALYLNAASEFLKANEGTSKMAAQVGPLLILKLPSPNGPEVQVKKLSTDQLIALEKNQSWLTSPSDVLAKLEAACASDTYDSDSITAALLRSTSVGKFRHPPVSESVDTTEDPPPLLPPP